TMDASALYACILVTRFPPRRSPALVYSASRMLQPVCVRLPNWVGDACMALPALHLLSRAGYSLVLAGRPWARDLLAGLPHTDFIALEGPLRRDAQRLRTALHSG